MSVVSFYRAFEDRYRGSRELIRGRLEAYRPFITPLLALHQPATAIDLGCGRGEWLELLRDAGFQAHGVDMDAGMLASCTERGLSVSLEDAPTYLRKLDEASQSIVSAFHFVEHIPFEVLRTLVAEALRVLKPGGLLILETPNPENLVVGAHSFYLDPTHHRPIPPLLLSFLVDHLGFGRVQVQRLQEAPELHKGADVSLMTVLEGASPDYAVVAQKSGSAEFMQPLDAAFAAPSGITLHELAARYDHRTDLRFDNVDLRFSALEQRLEASAAQVQERLEVLAGQMQERLDLQAFQTQERLRAVERVAQARPPQDPETLQAMQALQERLRALEADSQALRQSWSWRITAPLRAVAGLGLQVQKTARQSANLVISRGIETFHRPLAGLMSRVLRNAERSARINDWLVAHFPALHGQLRSLAARAGLVPEHAVAPVTADTDAAVAFDSLSIRARQIYAHIQGALGGSH
ncbi:methyltransferase domain-containing protein [Acidovorax sp. M2(2025)]|uniref:class I SAM-dependent methyltransferase n=1 Tax=Acidovorax sp. M2(2025) TaxID=3411355 RepID=UPI003BF4BAE6